MIYFGSPVLIRPASWLPLLVSTLLSISLAHVHISRCGSPYLRRAAGGEGEVEFFVCILLRVFACKLFGDDEGGRLFGLSGTRFRNRARAVSPPAPLVLITIKKQASNTQACLTPAFYVARILFFQQARAL